MDHQSGGIFMVAAAMVLLVKPVVLFILARAFFAKLVRIRVNGWMADSAGIYRIFINGKQPANGKEIINGRSDALKGYFDRLSQKMTRCGYKGIYAGYWYFTLRFVFPVCFCITSCISAFPNVISPLAASFLMFMIPGLFTARKRKNIKRLFQRNAYKIYQYLYNQISSGIKAHDAVKGLYEVMEDGVLREVLIKLSARYELTRDIDSSLEEVRARFDFQEAETLCIALKQGIATGDNSAMLARQEEVMFSKYLNYMQSQTEQCKLKSLVAVTLFTAIIVIMVMIPLFMDVSDSMSRIFLF